MPILASAVSAAVLALALPNELAPYGIPFLGFFCLAPHFAAVAKSRSYREAALLGFLFGSLSHFLSSYWLMFFKDYAIWTIGATSLAYGGLHIIVALYLRRFSLLGERFAWLRPFALAAVWTVWECLKSTGFFAYPWGLVAYAVNEVHFLTQIVDATGVYGLSFFLSLSSAVIFEFGLRSGSIVQAPRVAARAAVVLATVAVWFMVYGAYALTHPTPVVDRVPVVLVQHNGDSWVQGGESASLRTCQELSRKGVEAFKTGKAVSIQTPTDHFGAWDRPALVVWSETVLRRPFADYKPYFRKQPARDPFIPFLAELGVPLLTGAPIVLDWQTYDATNSAILLSPEGEMIASYAKSHLVPFAETVPFWEYSWMRSFMKKVAGLEGQWNAGTEQNVMTVPTPSGRPLAFGVPICFEDAFADVCARFFRNGADVLINLTNDSWSLTVSAETQHLVAARFRSIENRRVLIRSTNGGVTSVIDAEGRVVASLPLFVEDALAVTVPIQKKATATTYFILGDWFPFLLFLALFALVVGEFARDRAARSSERSVAIADLEDLRADDDPSAEE